MSDVISPARPSAVASGPQSEDAELLAALGRADADGAIERALARLERDPDPALAAATAAALARAGVPGLARRLLRSLAPALPPSPEIEALLDQIEQLPSGETPWADLADRYRANCHALLRTRPHLRGIVDPAAAVADQVHLFITAQGNAQIVRDGADGSLRFVFPFADQHRNAAALRLGRVENGAGFLLLGAPGVPLLKRLLALRLDTGYRPPIDIIEPDPAMLVMWLHLLDAPEALVGARLGVFAGDHAPAQYEAHRAANLQRRGPTHTITSHRPGWRPPVVDDAFRRRVRMRIDSRRSELRAKQDVFYRDRTPAEWAERFRRAGIDGPPLRIVAFATRYSTVTRHVMRDLGRAFRRRGCAFTLVTEDDDSCSDLDTWSPLACEPFDLVILLHRLRSQLDDRVHPNVPFVCWMQDHVPALRTRDAGRSVGPLDLVLGPGKGMMTALYEYPPDRFIATSNLTDVETFSGAPAAAEDLARYRCDVSYVSHGSATPEQMVRALGQRKGPGFAAYLLRIVESMRRRLAEAGWVGLADRLAFMMQAEAKTAGLSLTPEERGGNVYPVVASLFDRLVRHETLQWAADWAEASARTLRLYGRGWEEHPTLARFACGEIEHGYPLRCLYQASAVSLQINAYGSLHQRLLDAVMAGGCVLSRFNPDDFIRRPKLALRDLIRRENIAVLDELLRRAEESPELASLIDELHELRRFRIAPMSDPQRRREMQLFRQALDYAPAMVDDRGLFESLASVRFMPHRVAGDVPGFERTVFRSRRELFQLLDRFVDAGEARTAAMRSLRGWVAEHGTYDGLVRKILAFFGARRDEEGGDRDQ